MDISILARKIREIACRPRECDTLGSFSERRRECNPKYSDFWTVVMFAMRLRILVEMKVSFTAECDLVIVLLFLLQANPSAGILTNESNPLKIELPRYETARAPPRRFIPTPRIEIGGCARSDSLVRPLTF